MDNIISKVPQFKTFKRKLSEKGENGRLAKQSLKRRLTQMQEQMPLLQTHSPGELSSIWSPSLPPGVTKPPQIDIPLFAGDVLKRKEFWDMFEVSLIFIKKRGMQRLINLFVWNPSNNPTVRGLLTRNSRNSDLKWVQVKCISCDQSHWSDEYSNCSTLQKN